MWVVQKVLIGVLREGEEEDIYKKSRIYICIRESSPCELILNTDLLKLVVKFSLISLHLFLTIHQPNTNLYYSAVIGR